MVGQEAYFFDEARFEKNLIKASEEIERVVLMEIKESVAAAVKEYVFPELKDMQRTLAELKVGIETVHKRLDDQTAHLVDQSRRIDAIRSEMSAEFKAVRSEMTAELKEVRSEMTAEFKAVRGEMQGVRSEIREIKTWMDKVYADLIRRNDETNMSIARLYEVIVRRDEHKGVEERVAYLEREMASIKERLAA